MPEYLAIYNVTVEPGKDYQDFHWFTAPNNQEARTITSGFMANKKILSDKIGSITLEKLAVVQEIEINPKEGINIKL